jgi:hypothetical protein
MGTTKTADVTKDGRAAPPAAVDTGADAQPGAAVEGCRLGRELGDCPLRRSGCATLYDVLRYLMPPGHVREHVRAGLCDDPAAMNWLARLDLALYDGDRAAILRKYGLWR